MMRKGAGVNTLPQRLQRRNGTYRTYWTYGSKSLLFAGEFLFLSFSALSVSSAADFIRSSVSKIFSAKALFRLPEAIWVGLNTFGLLGQSPRALSLRDHLPCSVLPPIDSISLANALERSGRRGAFGLPARSFLVGAFNYPVPVGFSYESRRTPKR